MRLFQFSFRSRLLTFGLALLGMVSFGTRAEAILDVQITEGGQISLSADGGGDETDDYTIQVNKPAGATVRSAFLTCASNNERVINDDDVTLDGTGISWDDQDFNSSGGVPNFMHNVFADVTSIVQPKVDGAAAGLVNFTVGETNSATIDGCALYVIFDDPSQTDNTVFILFGAQDPAGDSFSVTLANPLEVDDTAELGLGISFSTQGNSQISEVDVNSQRLTSAAGGQDDGEGSNGGGLITVGGIGDSPTNPADPNAGPGGDPRFDDELYDLAPFLGLADVLIDIFTVNPTSNDNIFTGHIFVTVPAIVGEGIVLSPGSDTNTLGADHTVTATVVDNNGNPVIGRDVLFEVISGPNIGDMGMEMTDINGEAPFTYTGDGGVGTDMIQASFEDSQMQMQMSNIVTKEWVEPMGDCDGATPTIMGTPGNDILEGTPEVDVIVGLAGDDIIKGRGGNDILCGDDGNDVITGDTGDDFIDGGAGDDNLKGQQDDDTIDGGSGRDFVIGDLGDDTCSDPDGATFKTCEIIVP